MDCPDCHTTNTLYHTSQPEMADEPGFPSHWECLNPDCTTVNFNENTPPPTLDDRLAQLESWADQDENEGVLAAVNDVQQALAHYRHRVRMFQRMERLHGKCWQLGGHPFVPITLSGDKVIGWWFHPDGKRKFVADLTDIAEEHDNGMATD